MGGPALIDDIEHEETDKFALIPFEINGTIYPSSEHFFQCSKATNDEDRDKILNTETGFDCWKAGSKIKLREDWEVVKVEIMYWGNKEKFIQNPDCQEKLINSSGNVYFYQSTEFWNKWNALIIQRIRAELRNTNNDEEVAHEISKLMNQYKEEKLKSLDK